MNEEKLLRRYNFLMSHGNLPYDTTTCETYGLSGNCGQKCPNFKNRTCEVYVDVLERINNELQQENQELKKVIDKAIDKLYCWGEALDPTFQKDLLDILKEVSE